MGPSWWSASKTLQDDRKENGKTKTAVLLSTVDSRQFFNMVDGFFGMKDRRRPAHKTTSVTERRHVINRPKDERNTIVGHGVPTTTTADRAVFGTESVCVSTNNGRPCLCCMIELLNSIGKRLDEMAAEDQMAVATAFRCSSYKPVPASFAVYTALNTTVAPINETTTAVNMLGQNVTDNSNADVRVPRDVDFDYVVNYELETFKDDKDNLTWAWLHSGKGHECFTYHYVVHYSLEGSDVILRCLINSDGNNTEMKTYKWDYTKPKNNTSKNTGKSVTFDKPRVVHTLS